MIQEIPVDRIQPSPYNPRRELKASDPSIIELAKSIKIHGQLQPGIVRAHPDIKNHYELIAGYRRWKACQQAGIRDYLASVVEVTEHQAIEMIVTENLQREDLTPLEEARGIKTLLSDGRTLEDAARVLGKSVRWVARRINLLELSPEIMSLVEDPESPASLWTIGMLEDVAALPMLTQERLSNHRGWQFPNTPSALAGWIADKQRELSKAPWDIEDDSLDPVAGRCSMCIKQSGAQPELFGDEIVTGGRRCMDVVCWKRKLEAHKRRQISTVQQKKPDILFVESGGGYDDDESEIEFEGALSIWKYEKVKKGAKGAVEAYVVSGESAGKTIWILPHDGSEAARRAARKAAKARTADDPKAQLAEKMDALDKRRAALQVRLFADALESTAWADLSPRPVDDVLLSLAATIGTVDKAWNMPQAFKSYGTLIESASGIIRETLWKSVRAVIVQRISAQDGEHAQRLIKVIFGLAEILPVSHLANEAREKANEQIPETRVIRTLREQIAAAKKAGAK